MIWTKALINAYIENYHELKEYNILPWEVVDTIGGQPARRGPRTFDSPFEDQAILNAEFDMAIRKLGEVKELAFRLYYLNSYRIDQRELMRIRRTVKGELIDILLSSEFE